MQTVNDSSAWINETNKKLHQANYTCNRLNSHQFCASAGLHFLGILPIVHFFLQALM